MKKIYLLAAMALIMIGCSSNDEENLPADELLADTEWRHGHFEDDDFLDKQPSTSISTGEDYNKFLDKYFPNMQYTKGEIFSTEKSDTIKSLEEVSYRNRLVFTNVNCKYYEESYTITDMDITKTVCKNQTSTYLAQSLTSPVRPDMKVQVTKDAIILYQTYPYTGQQLEQLYLSLNNFQSTLIIESIKSTSTEYEITHNEKIEETFSYQRNGNEVVLTNSNKKWIGTLDTDNWTLSFVQIVPEKKEIPTLSLK